MNGPDRKYPDLPKDIEAEGQLLGALFMKGADLPAILSVLTPDDFSEEVHSLIFDGMAQLAARNEPISPVALKSIIGEHPLSGGMTTNQYLASLVASAPHPREAPQHAAAVKRASAARRLVQIGYRVEREWMASNRERLIGDSLAIVQAVGEQAGAGKPKDFGRIRLGDVAKRERRPLDYIIDDWLVSKEQSFIAGESQSGKSFLAMHAALCIATGRPFFDREVKPGLVIYQAGESGSGVLDLRIPAWLDHHGVTDAEKIPFEILPMRADLFSPEGDGPAFHALIKKIAAEWHPIPLRAVFIDTLSKAMPGANENDGRDISRVLSRFEAISRDTGAHVCVIHHLPKAGGSMRGHGSLKGDVDSVAMIEHNQATGVRTMRFAKRKDGPAGGSLSFELMAKEIGVDDKGKRITSCVCLPVGDKEAIHKSEAAKGYRLTDSEIVFMRALFEAEKRHGLAVPPDLDVPAGVRWVVPYADMKAAYGVLNPLDTDTSAMDAEQLAKARKDHAEKLKKRAQRTREFLTGAGIISFAREFIYWTGRPLRAFPHTHPQAEPEPVAPPPPSSLDDNLGFPL